MASARAQQRNVLTQPATAAGAGVSLTSLVPLFLPPEWHQYGYAAAAVLGLIAPLLISRAGGRGRASDLPADAHEGQP
jgi:hypothetical protein